MKKALMFSVLVFSSLYFFGFQKVQIEGLDLYETENELIAFSDSEDSFYKTMKIKDEAMKNDYLIIDTINGTNNEFIEISGIQYEKNAILYSLYQAHKNNLLSQFLSNSTPFVGKLVEKAELSKEDLSLLLEDSITSKEDLSLLVNLIPKDTFSFTDDISLNSKYYYETVYVGYFETYNYLTTDNGIYSIQAEYYYKDSNKIYTGTTRYVLNARFDSYNHREVIKFDYQSYVALGYISAPKVKIYLINDFWGQEKMIVRSNDNIFDFKISREEHYNRNQYNKLSNTPVDILYPTENMLDTAIWKKQNYIESYFHRLLPQNNSNVKYLCPIEYIDINLGVLLNGDLELVYDNYGNIEYEDLVTFSFNFGVDESYPQVGLVSSAHYIRDVYPYLIWGNSLVDYKSHTAFERFVWDKDSVLNALSVSKGKNKSGTALTSLYESGIIGDYNGTKIPDVIQNNAARWDLYFDFISSKTISSGTHTNIDWSSQIFNEYSSVVGYISKEEIFDEILYSTPGKYKVKVGIRDAANRLRTQEFMVTVSPC